MAEPIQSSYRDKSGALKYPDYFTMPLIAGVQVAPWRLTSQQRSWGKRPMIEFLIRLGTEWGRGDNWWYQVEQFGNYCPILLGDISPEGGANKPPRRDPVDDHSSHKVGMDVDIYIFRKDGQPKPTTIDKPNEYDRQRTLWLAELIIEIAGKTNIGKFYFQDEEVQKIDKATITSWPNHKDHFHIRLGNGY